MNGGDDAGTPWYLREYDGGKPQVTLDDLRGDGPVARRMVKGFFLALDHDFGSNGSRWWKTTGSLLAPYERIFVYKGASDFHGLWMQEGPHGGLGVREEEDPERHRQDRRGRSDRDHHAVQVEEVHRLDQQEGGHDW